MKNIKVLMLAVAGVFALGLGSCVNDLDVTPIDPNVQLPQDVLQHGAAFEALLA